VSFEDTLKKERQVIAQYFPTEQDKLRAINATMKHAFRVVQFAIRAKEFVEMDENVLYDCMVLSSNMLAMFGNAQSKEAMKKAKKTLFLQAKESLNPQEVVDRLEMIYRQLKDVARDLGWE